MTFPVSARIRERTLEWQCYRLTFAAHSYQYTFAPNPQWSSLYAPGHEIQQYLQNVADKFGATRFIKTHHKLLKAIWNASTKKWMIHVEKTDSSERFEEEIDVLITARGLLNEPSWPNVPGLDEYKGKLLHSGDWDDT